MVSESSPTSCTLMCHLVWILPSLASVEGNLPPSTVPSDAGAVLLLKPLQQDCNCLLQFGQILWHSHKLARGLHAKPNVIYRTAGKALDRITCNLTNTTHVTRHDQCLIQLPLCETRGFSAEEGSASLDHCYFFCMSMAFPLLPLVFSSFLVILLRQCWTPLPFYYWTHLQLASTRSFHGWKVQRLRPNISKTKPSF